MLNYSYKSRGAGYFNGIMHCCMAFRQTAENSWETAIRLGELGRAQTVSPDPISGNEAKLGQKAGITWTANTRQ